MSNQIEYHDKVNAEFAEAVYQEMASARYGIDFCCTPDLNKWSIKKQLLDLNALQLNICPDLDNPAQPGDANFVPGPCGVLDVVYEQDGGTISYVPCGAFIRVSKQYGPNETGTDKLCYDTNAGYTVETISDTMLSATESEENCDSDVFCDTLTITIGKDGGILIYTSCEGDAVTVNLIGSEDANYGPVCVRKNQYSLTGSLTASVIDMCTE